MENNGYHLDLFTNSMIQYFNEVLIHKNYVSTSFRKYSLKDGEDTEFSFQIKPPANTSDCDEEILNRGSDSAYFTREDFDKLITSSQLWSLHLADVSIKGSRLLFRLDQLQAHSSIIKSILNEETSYGVKSIVPLGVAIDVNDDSTQDLSQMRLRLIKETAENVMSAVKVENCGNRIEIYLTTKPVNTSKLNVLCGVVINSATGTKATELMPDDYYKTQLNDMRKMSEHKYWDMEREELIHKLALANVRMSLLEVNPKNNVSVRFDSNFNKPGGSMSKGAVFVLYNYARICSILRTFQEKCDQGVYTDPPDVNDVDFSLLKEKEEWCMLFNYLLEYPVIIRKFTEELPKGILNTHKICRFLSNLSSLFSVYYRRVRILMEPKQHLLPLIFVRIQFLKAVHQVMYNAVSLLGIQMIEEI